jgi:hypothetical protein
MTCDICSCDTGSRRRIHSTPSCCEEAIRRELFATRMEYEDRQRELMRRLTMVQTSDTIVSTTRNGRTVTVGESR